MANNLCFSYYQEGRFQEAETCFRQTLDRDPGNVAARNNLGLLYCRLGRQDEARRLWQAAEGVAAADAKMNQALASLGMPESAVYARRPEPTPPVAGVTQAPAPKTAAARLTAAIPAKPDTSAQPVTPTVSAGQLASKPPAPAPTLVAAKPPAPAPVSAKPRPEAWKQAVVAQKAPTAVAPAPAPRRRPEPSAPLTVAEPVDTAIEVRNGAWTQDLAQRPTPGFVRKRLHGGHDRRSRMDFGATKNHDLFSAQTGSWPGR